MISAKVCVCVCVCQWRLVGGAIGGWAHCSGWNEYVSEYTYAYVVYVNVWGFYVRVVVCVCVYVHHPVHKNGLLLQTVSHVDVACYINQADKH
jgi:hypothetical protein